jgi:hypothetical protein
MLHGFSPEEYPLSVLNRAYLTADERFCKGQSGHLRAKTKMQQGLAPLANYEAAASRLIGSLLQRFVPPRRLHR